MNLFDQSCIFFNHCFCEFSAMCTKNDKKVQQRMNADIERPEIFAENRNVDKFVVRSCFKLFSTGNLE